jgi:sulfite reductase (ferredoxin)
LTKIIEIYRKERTENESLSVWIGKLINGAINVKSQIKNLDDMKTILMSTTSLPSAEEDPDAYMDYGNDMKFSAKTARGECAA